MQPADNQKQNDRVKQPVAPPGILSALEKTAWIQLSNRFVWLIMLVTLLNMAMVSLLQLQFVRFDTMELMSIIGLFIEIGLFSAVLVMFLATPVTLKRWAEAVPGQRFSYPLNGLAICLNGCLLLIILLAPVMYFHSYPELAASGLRIPLMMLQRESLVLFAILISANIMLISQHVLRIHWIAAGIAGIIAQLTIGYSITYLSYSRETFLRLNDVFFYNQLSKRFDWFPELLTDHVFHNMELVHFGYYLSIAAGIWLFTYLLWVPAALKRSTIA